MSVSSIPRKVALESSRGSSARSGSIKIEESRWSKILTRELDDIKSAALWRGAFAELIGCLILNMFTIGIMLRKEGEPGPPLFHVAVGVGFIITFLITSLSQVSGGHVNPAVSIGFFLTGQITFIRFVIFSMFQTIGAIVGTGLLKLLLPADHVGNLGLLTPGEGVSPGEVFGMEFLITCNLLFMIMSFVDSGRNDIAGSVPFIVGLVVTANILLGAVVSGGCMNPVRNFGPAMILGEFDNMWIYWTAPMAGGIVGTLLYDWFFSTKPLNCKGICGGSSEEESDDLEEIQDNKALLSHPEHTDFQNLDNSPESKV